MQDWDEARRWRKARRAELTAKRLAISLDDRAKWDAAVTARLEQALPAPGRLRVGFYWPFKGEYDPRALARSLHGRGARLCLPVVVERARPLAFREWWPGMRMAPGVWGIPVPAEGESVMPEVLLVPLLGFDGSGYRLGYGGGYYDRTLAAMPIKPLAIGIGYEPLRLATIHPRPHDVPMDLIVTERQAVRMADGGSTGTDASAAPEGHGPGGEEGAR
ncbi:MAG: 5-formyltetrahydrofolate cyclo-ligase [Acetobacteraceae bacterium]|nr:5-formyltetrahydrofolate cyclo-ligase [Acetobacteraceae bacterium]